MSGCVVSGEAIERVVSLLSNISLEDVLSIEEADPQYESALAVCTAGGLAGAVSFFLAALSAYRLRCTGEEYWARFAEYFIKEKAIADPVEKVVRFLLRDKCSTYLREVKASRVRKFSNYSTTVSGLLSSCNFKQLWSLTSRVLDSDSSSKTVVFSVKMGYYCGRALKLCRGPLPMDIPIPVDSRVAKASISLGILPGLTTSEAMRRCREKIIFAWKTIGESVGIPPVHLDTLVWALQNPATLSKAIARLGSESAIVAIKRLYSAIK